MLHLVGTVCRGGHSKFFKLFNLTYFCILADDFTQELLVLDQECYLTQEFSLDSKMSDDL